MILLFSGGIDSHIAYHWLEKPPTLYFNLHTPYSEKEMRVIKELIPDTIIEDCINLGTRQSGEKAYIPYRNLHLALLANKYSDKIVIAGLKDDMVDDKNKDVFAKWSFLMTTMTGRIIEVASPFWHRTKEDIVDWYINDYGGERRDLLKTISCYSEEDTNYCGRCPACFRKWCVLVDNGIRLPFHNKKLSKEYYDRARNNYYLGERNRSIIRAIVHHSTGVL